MSGGTYRIQLSTAAVGQLAKLEPAAQQLLTGVIDALASTPRPEGSKVLQGGNGDKIRRVRAGNYRVLYQIFDKELLVYVVRLGDRKDQYDNSFWKRIRKQLR